MNQSKFSLLVILSCLVVLASSADSSQARLRRNTHKPPTANVVPVKTPTSSTPIATTPTTSTTTPAANPIPSAPIACVAPSTNPAIASYTSGPLSRLAAIQTLTHTQPASQVSLFIPTPVSSADALNLARDLSAQFATFNKLGLEPVIFMEPTSLAGSLLKLQDISNGKYNTSIAALFTNLKQQGITDSKIGTWIAYPEINTPAWNRTGFTAGAFGPMVNQFSRAIKAVFPSARVGILMESFSYQLNTNVWENGTASSWLPYLQAVEPNAVDVIGMQAFWFPADQFATLFQFSPQFGYSLDSALALEAAKFLNVHSILIQTGTPHTVYLGWLDKMVTIDQATRSQALTGIANSAKALQAQGYGVTLSLFSENKANTDEAKDWSYYSEDAATLASFTNTLYCSGIKLVIF